MNAHYLENGFFIALLAIAIFLSWLILQPYLSALVIAGTLAFIFRPLYEKFLQIFRYKFISALSVVLVVILIVFVPIGIFALRVLNETTSLYVSLIADGGFDFGAAITGLLHAHFSNLHIPDVTLNFSDAARGGLTWFLENLQFFFSDLAQILFAAFLSLIGLFYILKDGNELKERILDLSPLNPKYTEQIMHEVEVVGKSVIEGTLVVAILQGIVVGAGFFIFRIPDPAFWGALTVLTSIIPIVGTWIVVVPGIAYLFFSGEAALSIGFAIWSILLVNLVYNLVTPQFVHRHSDIHPYIILLSVLGGLGLFGPIGFLMGPFIVAFLFSLLKIYPKLILHRSS